MFGELGGMQSLRDRFGLAPDDILESRTSSPLLIRKLPDQTDNLCIQQRPARTSVLPISADRHLRL